MKASKAGAVFICGIVAEHRFRCQQIFPLEQVSLQSPSQTVVDFNGLFTSELYLSIVVKLLCVVTAPQGKAEVGLAWKIPEARLGFCRLQATQTKVWQDCPVTGV